MSTLANVVAPDGEVGQWTTKVGLPELDLKKKIESSLPGGDAEVAVQIKHQYEIKWGRRNWTPKDVESASVDQGRILCHGAKVDPDGFSLVNEDIERKVESVVREIQAYKPPVPKPGAAYEPDWLPWKYANLAVSMAGSPAADRILREAGKRKIIPEYVAETIRECMMALRGDHTEHTGVHKNLATYLKMLVPQPPQKNEGDGDGESDRNRDPEEESKRTPPRSGKPPPPANRMTEQERQEKEDRYINMMGGKPPKETGLYGQWGKNRLLHPPLTKPLAYKTLRFRPGEAGVLQNATRLLTDGLAFRDYRRKVKGSVLIDCSGSMNPDPALIEEIVARSSAAVVALYAGSYRDNNKTGVTMVVGRDGKVVESVPRAMEEVAQFNHNNLVDGPALQWLARQEAPRIWVSDGEVTGLTSDRTGLLIEAAMICKWNGIMRVNSLQEAIPFFTARR